MIGNVHWADKIRIALSTGWFFGTIRILNATLSLK